MSFAPINGTEIYFEISGDGCPLVLLHAGVGDSRMWDAQWAHFAKYYSVIRCDLRGFGKSLHVQGQFSYYEDVAILFGHLNIKQAHIVGLSFGGYVALDFALSYPDKVSTLVLGAPYLGGYQPTSNELLRFFKDEEAALDRGDLNAATELNLRMWVDGPYRRVDKVNPAIRERVREMQLTIFSQPNPGGTVECELHPPAADRLHEINAPTLVIVGEQIGVSLDSIPQRKSPI